LPEVMLKISVRPRGSMLSEEKSAFGCCGSKFFRDATAIVLQGSGMEKSKSPEAQVFFFSW